jgi:hypothetical protein
LSIHLLEHRRDAAGVLRPHPVELEPVGHEQRDLGKIFRNLARQRLDPGDELLLGEFLRKLVDARLPEAVARSAQAGSGCQPVVLPLAHGPVAPVDYLYSRKGGF